MLKEVNIHESISWKPTKNKKKKGGGERKGMQLKTIQSYAEKDN